MATKKKPSVPPAPKKRIPGKTIRQEDRSRKMVSITLSEAEIEKLRVMSEGTNKSALIGGLIEAAYEAFEAGRRSEEK